MNSIELKELHDLMQGAYDRTLIASSQKNYMPTVSEFTKELATNPILENDRQVVANMGREALIPLVEIKVKVLCEIEIAIALIEGYQPVIPILSIGIEEIHKIRNRCPANSMELICNIYEIVRQMCNLIKHDHPTKHAQILKELIKLSKENNIIEYIFSLSFLIMHQEIINFDRDRKLSLYNSFAYLIRFYLFYDLKSRPNKIQNFLQNNHHSAAYYLSLDAENFDKAMEEPQSDEKFFDIEECRVHMHRVWEFIKPRVSIDITSSLTFAAANSQNEINDNNIVVSVMKQCISFSSRGTTVLVRYGINEMPFNTKHRTGRFVRAFIKNPSEPISYKILWSKVAGLPIAEDLCDKEENELHEARKSVNKQLKKIGLSSAFEKTRITDAKNSIKKMWLNPKYSIQ